MVRILPPPNDRETLPIKPIQPDPTFFPGHAAAIHLRMAGKEQVIGVFGILHPSVLEKFELR